MWIGHIDYGVSPDFGRDLPIDQDLVAVMARSALQLSPQAFSASIHVKQRGR